MVRESVEKPLHVRVAEALGCKLYFESSERLGRGWRCGCQRPEVLVHGETDDETPPGILRYDTDWAATGPLVETLGISLACTAQTQERGWIFGYADLGAYQGPGHTPLIAVCNLILALKEAGKLPS